jgi:outer membrane protein OmpA-like peptidoglycan-associated protein
MRLKPVVLLFLLAAGPAHSLANLNGESGLYRMPSAEVMEPGHMALTLGSAFHGWDPGYAPSARDALLMDEQLSLAYGFSPFFECAATGRVHGDFTGSRSPVSVGDSRISAKLIYPPYPHREEFDLAVLCAVNVPSGSKKAGIFRRRVFYNEDYPFSSGDAHLEFLFPFLINFTRIGQGAPLKLHLYFGGDFTTSSATHDMYQAGLGLEYLPTPRLTPFLEVNGETRTKQSLSPELDPLFATLGFSLDLGMIKLKCGGEYLLSVATAKQVQEINGDPVETGLYPHYGLFINASLSGTLVRQDSDRDDIPDNSDKCPAAAEDRDGFEDQDGCPDLDNDRDGIPDALDKCPDRPEEADGFEDQDGCPDLDNDHDGIPDLADHCVNTPEDMDGFDDKDGCPDLDNDRDGILDEQDRCPGSPEDRDGFEDLDGCPDTDNDRDGIPDSLDKCLSAPETFNAIDDQDGCPDGRVPALKLGESALLPDLRFQPDESLAPPSYEILIELAMFLRNHPDTRIEIRCHSDALGSVRQNARKTEKRAEAVRAFLTGRGVEPERLSTRGMGEDEPLATNETPAGREKNNRVEIKRIP